MTSKTDATIDDRQSDTTVYQPNSEVVTGENDDLEKLKRAARERWGDEWAVEQRHWADGTTTEHAYHIEPTDEAGVGIRDRLFVGADGDIYHDKVRVQHEKTVEILERDEPPEEATSEYIRE